MADLEADFVIVGAGSAGCVLADRLSEDGARVVLLEAGPSDWHPMIHVPAGALHLRANPLVNWNYYAEAEEGTGNRSLHWPRGRVLGGTSSINGMLYVRGNPADYDGWAQMGCRGWSYADILPYFKKSEHYVSGESEYRGKGGPLLVEDYRTILPLTHRFVEAAQEAGFAFTRDYNGAQQEGAGYSQMTRRGRLRGSTARTFLAEARRRQNLRVETKAIATRLLFDGTRATGVEYERGGTRQQVRARREVVLCGGAINSPQLLEISGVGDARLLQRLGVPVVADVPAVGSGLQDHLAVNYVYRSRVPTLNDQLRPFFGKVRAALRYAVTRRGPLSMSVNQAGAFLRSRPEYSRPNLHIYFNPASYSTTTSASKRRLTNPDPWPGFLMSFNTCRPTSRGSVHIKSPDPHVSPSIVPNSLSTPADVQDVFDGAKLVRQIAAAAPLAAVTLSEHQPGATLQSDAEVLADFRQRAGSVFHATCTCAMGTDPRSAVLDARLRVRGLGALRVADASAFPNVTSGNTNTPTIMLAEKAADLILEDSRAPAG